jgi:hypothetical protein
MMKSSSSKTRVRFLRHELALQVSETEDVGEDCMKDSY